MRSSRWWKHLPMTGGILLMALLGAALMPRAVPVEVASVAVGPLVVTVAEEGMTRVKHRYLVAAPVGGQLRRIDWKAGAVVEAGKTVLAVLEGRGTDFLDTRSQVQAEARVRGAEAARDSVRAHLGRAQAGARRSDADFVRVQSLRRQGAVSTQDYEAAQMLATSGVEEVRAVEFSAKVADYEVLQAQAILGLGLEAGEKVTPLAITSPITGRILRIMQESARVVPAGFILMEVGDPTDLEVRIEVLSRDGVRVGPGARVILDQWGGREPLAARVRHVEPAAFTKISALGVEEQRVYVIADLLDGPERRPTLGDGFRVEARIVISESADVLRVPAGATFERSGEEQVYVVVAGRAELRRIKLGRTNGRETEVLAGLMAGERVVVYPGDKVTIGTRVEVLKVSTH
jgi:HlyD family secretion protein